jgi:hypothetical protein
MDRTLTDTPRARKKKVTKNGSWGKIISFSVNQPARPSFFPAESQYHATIPGIPSNPS